MFYVDEKFSQILNEFDFQIYSPKPRITPKTDHSHTVVEKLQLVMRESQKTYDEFSSFIRQKHFDVLIIDPTTSIWVMAAERSKCLWASFSVTGFLPTKSKNPADEYFNSTWSPFLHIVPATSSLVRSDFKLPPNAHLVGPATLPHAQRADWISELNPNRPLILISTLSAAGVNYNRADAHRYFQAIIDGLGGQEYEVVLVLADGSEKEGFCTRPNNIRIESYIPYEAILPQTSIVISHGGYGTTTSALWHGIPLVMVPFGTSPDHEAITNWCVEAGVGIYQDVKTLTGIKLQQAVQTLLKQPKYSFAAKKMSEEFHRLNPAEKTADLIECLATTRSTISNEKSLKQSCCTKHHQP